MSKKRVFISYDYDNDDDIKKMLAGQAKLDDSPFDFVDGSIKEHLTGDWKTKAKGRIGNCDLMIVLCGKSTHTAAGVAAELEIAQALGKPYFHISGRSGQNCTKPLNAKAGDKLYEWTWQNLKNLIGGSR